MKILSGTSNPTLATQIADYLDQPLVRVHIERFADQELYCRIDENVHGANVFVIQSTSQPANEHLMEMLILIDALKRNLARHVTAVIPYFGYARQDRKTAPGAPITAKLVSNLIAKAGADQIISLDWHKEQMQGFFDIPAYDLDVSPLFVKNIQADFNPDEIVLVSPDIGGVLRARKLADYLNCDIAILEKRRIENAPVILNLIGSVKGKTAILVDDIIDSGRTVCLAAQSLMEAGAKDVRAYITHGVFSGKALNLVEASMISQMFVTDTIAHTKASPKVHTLSIAPLVAKAMQSMATMC